MSIKITNEIFIERSIEIYGDMFGYDKLEYTGRNNKITLYCKKHSDYFETTPESHYKHVSCSHCKKENKIANSELLSTEEFIEKANIVHNYKFDYSKTVYTGANNYVVIICPMHGEFKQRAQGHLMGKSCALCKDVVKLNTDEFIQRARNVHGDVFDYSEVEYVNSDTKVKIICKKHGPFYMVPFDHSGKRMRACPYCRASKGEIKVLNVLKTLNVIYDRQWKFSDCKYKKQLPFDFIVVYDNKFGLIEYQGEQHYKPCRYSKDMSKNLEKFEDCQRNDNIKLDYCVDNKIPLLRLVYNEDENLQMNILNFVDVIKNEGCSFKGDMYAKTN
jgi:hypothetical protein